MTDKKELNIKDMDQVNGGNFADIVEKVGKIVNPTEEKALSYKEKAYTPLTESDLLKKNL